MAKTEFDVQVSTHGLGYSKPHKMGNRLWLPMFAMAVMAFPVAFILGIARASIVSDFGVQDEGAQKLAHWVPAIMFIGFLAVFAAVSFSIARILGRFRKGGGEIQESTGGQVNTLKMPITAKIFLVSMMMGMMMILVAVILHFAAIGSLSDWNPGDSERWARVLEGFRRLGTALYLFGITFGLGTIIHVVRFQSIRVRELPDMA